MLAGLRARVRWWEAVPAVAAIVNIVVWYAVDASNRVFPDTGSYLSAARRLHLTVFGGFREPVFPALLAIPQWAFGHGETVARITTTAIFLGLVLTVQYVGRRWWGRGWGVGAALAIAASPYLGFYAVSGLREELACIGIIGVGFAVTRAPLTRWQWLGVAFATGVTAMIRWDTLMLTLPVVALALLLGRVGIRTIALCTLVVVAVVSPFIVGNWRRNDDPFYSSNKTAAFHRNDEFAGQPGYITRAEFERDAYQDPTTWGEYVFGDHEPDELVRRFVEAPLRSSLGITAYALFYPEPPTREPGWPDLGETGEWKLLVAWAVVIAAALGAVCMIRRGRWPFALLLLLAVLQHFPIVGLPHYDIRLETAVYPLMVLAVVELVRTVATRGSDREPATV